MNMTIKMYVYVFCLGKLFLNNNEYNACALVWENSEYVLEKLNERK